MTVCDELPKGCRLEWNFWGSGHGKGPHDGAGACLKQALRKEQLKRTSQKLHNAADVVGYLPHAMSLPNRAYPLAKRVVNRKYHLIGEKDVSRKHPLACKTVSGSRSIHSIRSVGPQNNTLLQIRNYSCFCNVCIYGSAGICPSRGCAAPWKFVTLEPIAAEEAIQESEDLEDLEWVPRIGSNDLAAELVMGDHFAVLADAEDPFAQGATFFVLICTKAMYTVEEERSTDSWKGTVDRDDEVVEGLYYH